MNASSISTSPAIDTPILTVINGKPTTTSNQVAAHFIKRHDTVLRAIDNLDCSADFRLHNFAESSETVAMPKGGTRQQRSFVLTRDGFTFLCMGFTGKQAAAWKEKYIDAFNAMEATIKGEATNPRFRPDKTRVTLPGGLSIEQQDAVKALVKSRADALPHDKRGAASIRMWSSIKSKYNISTYKELPPEHFTAALSLVARVPLNGELMPPEPAPRMTCADMLKINLSEEAKNYGCDPTLPLPDDIRAAMESKAWELARQTYAMSATFMTRCIAYSSEMGSPRRVDQEHARNVIDETSLELITMNKTIRDMKAIRALAGVVEGMASDFNKHTQQSLDGLLMRLGLAA